MSDLAPFVAAALRDKTVTDLQAELDKQKKVYEDMMKVEVTGLNGSPVYMEGHFHKGHYHSYHRWFAEAEHRQDCPLRDLQFIEVRLGGVVQFTLDPGRDQQVELFLEFGEEHNRDEYKDVLIKVSDGTELFINIYGWLPTQWRPLLQGNDDTWDRSAEEALEYFHRLPNRDDCVVKFDCIAFDPSKYEKLLEKVPLSEEQRRERQQMIQEHQETMALLGLIGGAGIPGPARDPVYDFLAFELDAEHDIDLCEQFVPLLASLFRLDHEDATEADYFVIYRRIKATAPEEIRFPLDHESNDWQRNLDRFRLHLENLVQHPEQIENGNTEE